MVDPDRSVLLLFLPRLPLFLHKVLLHHNWCSIQPFLINDPVLPPCCLALPPGNGWPRRSLFSPLFILGTLGTPSSFFFFGSQLYLRHDELIQFSSLFIFTLGTPFQLFLFSPGFLFPLWQSIISKTWLVDSGFACFYIPTLETPFHPTLSCAWPSYFHFDLEDSGEGFSFSFSC